VSALLKDPKTWYSIVAFLFGLLVTGPLQDRMWDWPRVWPWILAGLITASIIALWRRHVAGQVARRVANTLAFHENERRLANLCAEFALCKPVARLQPQDFGYELLDPGEVADIQSRPFYPRYVPRRIVPQTAAGSRSAGNTLTEADLVTRLAEGRNFAIIGQPIMGKSRTLYEVVSQLSDWVIIRPHRDRGIPPQEAFLEFVAGRSVVLVLEDLNDFAAGSAPDLRRFQEAIARARPERLAIAVTCRDGSELSVVGDAVDNSLRRFYDDIPLKLTLLPQTDEEKREIAGSAGRIWDPVQADQYPTPGSIVMEDALRYQRSRFEHDLSGEQQDALRSLQLLTAAGVIPLTHSRLEMVLHRIFQRTPSHLGDLLDGLAAASFLRPLARQDPVAPEPAYISKAVVTHIEGRQPIDDFPALRAGLVDTNDAEGLIALGWTLTVDHASYTEALAAIEDALVLQPDDPHTLILKGTALGLLERYDEALEAFEAVLTLQPDDPSIVHNAVYNKGNTLTLLDRHAEALAAFENALTLRPDDPRTLTHKGGALSRLSRHAEALAAYERSLELRPDHPSTLADKGATLVDLGRYDEGLADLEKALTLESDSPIILYNKGKALSFLGRHAEALEAYEESLKLQPHDPDPDTVYNMGVALASLSRYAEALRAFGVVLILQDRHAEALAAFEDALTLRPDDPITLYNKGVALAHLDRNAEALQAIDDVSTISPDFPGIAQMKEALRATSKVEH
jgi:tetratricopeptide (TPR) repeat protein